MIRAVIFDMDGLLVDSEPLAKEAWQAIARMHGGEISHVLFDRMLGLREVECAALVHTELGLTLPVETLCKQRNDLFLEHICGRLRPMPGVHSLLATLQARGIRRAIATSGERTYVDIVMRDLHLQDIFETSVVAEDVDKGKPAPDVYVLAGKRLEVPPEDCLVLEDAPNGIAAAKAAGMWCVAVPNAFTRSLDLSAADGCLASLVEVEKDLESLVSLKWPRRSCPPPCADGSCADCQS